MPSLARALVGVAALGLAACGSAATTTSTGNVLPATGSPSGQQQITVQITDANGQVVAVATLTPATASSASPSVSGSASASASASMSPSPSTSASPSGGTGSGVHFHVQVSNLSPGSHGFQIHAAGRCDGPRFVTAGPIFNPTDAAHGFLNPRGPKAGDLPDAGAGSDRTAVFDFTDSLVSLDPNAPNSLLGGNGTSLIITRDPDDQISQPEGAAGPRIACGVISPGSSASPSASGSSSGGGSGSGTSPSASPSMSGSASASSTP